MLLNESPYGAGIFPMHCTIRRVLRRSFRLIANVIPSPIILRRSFRVPNDRFGIKRAAHPRVRLFFIIVANHCSVVVTSFWLPSPLGLAPHLFSPYCESVNIHTKKMMQMARLAQ